MSAQGWRWALVAASLATVATGCRSMLEIPESARAGGYTSQEASDGWLFDRLMGRKPGATAPDASPAGPDVSSDVQPASGIEPILPPDRGPRRPPPPAATPDSEAEEDEDSGFQLSDLAPSKVFNSVKEMAGYGPNEEVARALYEEGQYLFQQGQYKEAAERFEQAVKRAPESPLQEDSLFMTAESQFFSDQYPKANDTYTELLKKYDNTRYLDTVVRRQFAIGRYWEQLDVAEPAWFLGFQFTDATRPKFDTWNQAIKAYRSVQMNDPTGPLADRSLMATANAYMRKGRYEDAGYEYDLICNEYPKSEYQLKAHLLGMEAKLHTYHGPMYDGSVLKDAAEMADQTLVQFGHELGSEREEVIRLQNAIREQRAERDWTLAQYYDKKRYFGAARFYYRSILEEYPLTAAAERAKARLEEIKGFPDRPPNHFHWLTDLFSSTSR